MRIFYFAGAFAALGALGYYFFRRREVIFLVEEDRIITKEGNSRREISGEGQITSFLKEIANKKIKVIFGNIAEEKREPFIAALKLILKRENLDIPVLVS